MDGHNDFLWASFWQDTSRSRGGKLLGNSLQQQRAGPSVEDSQDKEVKHIPSAGRTNTSSPLYHTTVAGAEEGKEASARAVHTLTTKSLCLRVGVHSEQALLGAGPWGHHRLCLVSSRCHVRWVVATDLDANSPQHLVLSSKGFWANTSRSALEGLARWLRG